MPTGTQTGQPPIPPDVKAQQQGDPAQQMAQLQMQKGQQQPAAQPADAGKEFVLKGFSDIAQTMTKMASVLQTDAPELMPMFVKAITALKLVEQEFSKQSQGQGQPVKGSEPQQQAEGPDTMAQ